jgi:predicted HicB family RNase H-like nuclease
MIHVRLSADRHRQLRVLAAQRDTSIQGLVSALIERELQSARKTHRK